MMRARMNVNVARHALTVLLLATASLHAGETASPPPPAGPDTVPHAFAREYAALAAARPLAPADERTFEARRREVLERHARALGVPLEHLAAPVRWRTVDVLVREGYEVRKIVFESRVGLEVPALLYVPSWAGAGARLPAVLSVHGHWSDAKAAAPVQLPCIVLARRGYVVLSVDAIGAGERSYFDSAKGAITYHGRQLGYGVLPSGLTLAGLQIEDNRRAIDLLQSLPEVDPARIGCTGASGGGNQTFHLTVMDPRVRAAVPVCFFGAFRGYLEGAHCACELVPGVLGYAEEGDLAGCVAPRPLLIVAAQRDSGAAFRIADARKSAELASTWYAAAGAPGACRLQEFDSDHDYNRDMREAMVAFFDRTLRGVDSGDRVEEAPASPEPVEEVRVIDPETPDVRLGASLTVPLIAAARAEELAVAPGDPRDRLMEFVLPRNRSREPMGKLEFAWKPPSGGWREGDLALEPWIHTHLRARVPRKDPRRALLVLAGGGDRYRKEEALRDVPDDVLLVEVSLRGTGPSAWPGAAAVDCPDYVMAQGSAVLGTPLLAAWTFESFLVVGALNVKPAIVYGEGVMGTVATLTAALDPGQVAAGSVDSLDRYTWPRRFDDRWPLALFAPGILKVGDLPRIAGLVLPRALAVGSPRDGGGSVLDAAGVARLREDVLAATPAAKRDEAGAHLTIEASSGPREVIGKLLEATR